MVLWKWNISILSIIAIFSVLKPNATLVQMLTNLLLHWWVKQWHTNIWLGWSASSCGTDKICDQQKWNYCICYIQRVQVPCNLIKNRKNPFLCKTQTFLYVSFRVLNFRKNWIKLSDQQFQNTDFNNTTNVTTYSHALPSALTLTDSFFCEEKINQVLSSIQPKEKDTVNQKWPKQTLT